MLLLFELSKEHETLPKAELLACLDVLSESYKEKIFLDGLLLVEASISSDKLEILAKRLGMTRNVYEVKGMSKPEEKEVLEVVKDVGFVEIMGKCDSATFAVRVKKDRRASFSNVFLYKKKSSLEGAIGKIIKNRGYEVDLSKPTKTFVLLFKEEMCFFCLLLHSVDKKELKKRAPHIRPFFSPGVILPKFARVIVNLSRVKEGDVLLDPFCGTGGILIEAGMIGVRTIGLDVQEKVVMGAKRNLRFYGLSGTFIVGDATRMSLNDSSVDVIVTDAPYGRSSLISSSSFTETEVSSLESLCLYKDALEEMHRVLKNKGKAVFVSNFPLSSTYNFCIIEKHKYRVHKSLSRYITVLEK